MATDALTAAPQRRWRGVLPFITHLWVGEQDEAQRATEAAQRAAEAATDEVKKLASHGAGFMSFARFISRPLMVVFSMGALLVLGGRAIADVYRAFTGHTPVNINEVASLIVMYSLIFAADIAMIVAAVLIQDALQRHRWTWVDKFAVVVLLGAALMESVTLAIMIATVEHPRTIWDWILIGGRSLFAPIIAIFLSLLHPRTPTDDDFRQVLAMRSYGLLLAKIKSDAIADDDIGLLYNIAATATGISEQAQANIKQLIAAFTAAVPGTISRQADALLAQKQAEWQTQMEKMRAAYQQQSQGYSNEKERLLERLSSLETAVNEARMAAQTARDEAALQAELELGNTLQKVLLSLAYQQRLPDAIMEQYPDIAALNVESMFQQSAKHSRGNAPAKAAKESPDNAKGQRAFLARITRDMDVKGTLYGTPKNHNGVWVLPVVVEALSDNKVSPDSARSIVKSLSHNAKIGTTYAAPFVEVMRHLSSVHALGDEARMFWQSAGDAQEDDVA